MEALIWVFVLIAVIGGSWGAILAAAAAFVVSRGRPMRQRAWVAAGAASVGAVVGAVGPIWYQSCSSAC